MTTKAAFTYKVGGSLTDAEATIALEFAGLDPDADFKTVNKCDFYTAVIDALMRDGVGIKMEREGGYTIQYDTASKKQYAYGLALESGCQSLIDKHNPQPKVRNKTYMW